MQLFPPSVESKLGFDVIRARLHTHVLGSMGREHVAAMRPSENAGWLRDELGRVAEMQEALRFDDPVPFGPMQDVRGELRRAAPEDSYLAPEELLAVRRMAGGARLLRGYFSQRKGDYPLLYDAVQHITPLPDLEEHIDSVVGEDGSVLDNASSELRRIRRTIVRRQAQLRETLQHELRRAVGQGYATEGQPTIRNGRMVIPVRAEAKRKVEGFVQDTSASGQTVYIEPSACLDLNNDVRSLQGEERREVERILQATTRHVRRHMDALHEMLRVLAQIDLIQAKARLSNELDAVVPALSEDGAIELRQARNPVLLLHVQRKQAEGIDAGPLDVVPLTLELGNDYRTLVITGPNAGGKTVAMKTVGLVALMLSYGLPVPVDDTSRLPLLDQIFGDIGDEQSIEEDLSTFSSHISNLRHILRHANSRTLVLIDEAGTGTDPAEGGALAQTVLEQLNSREVLTIATTHHGTLKVFAHQTEGVENGSMEFDHETLSPTYRFRAAVPGSSYAFEIAERIGLSADVIARARDLIGEQKAALEDLITTMEARSQMLSERLAEAERTLAEARQDKTAYEERLRKSEKERDEIRQQALEEAERIVQEANARVERTIREIKEAEAEREATLEVRRRLEAYKEHVHEDREQVLKEQKAREEDFRAMPERSEASPNGLEGPIRVGDHVRLDGGTMTAEVQGIEDDEVVVTAGSMRMRVARDRLTRVSGPGQASQGSSRPRASTRPIPSLTARQRVDLRGYHVEEALPEVERFLDEAVAAGIDRVEILHGKGTGALREAIHGYLNAEPSVNSFRDAPLERGGAGVTEILLKE